MARIIRTGVVADCARLGRVPDVEPDRLAAFALRVWGFKQGEVVSLMVHLGDRLGLYAP